MIVDNEPTLGLIYLPTLNKMLTAIKGKGAFENGEPIKVKNKKPNLSVIGIPDLRRGNEDIFNKLVTLDKELIKNYGKSRISGASCFDYAMVALGSYQVKVSYTPYLWDIAPGIVLVNEAGGSCLYNKKYSIAAASETLLNRAKNIIKENNWD